MYVLFYSLVFWREISVIYIYIYALLSNISSDSRLACLSIYIVIDQDVTYIRNLDFENKNIYRSPRLGDHAMLVVVVVLDDKRRANR